MNWFRNTKPEVISETKFRELLLLPRDRSLNAILTHKVLFHENGVVTKIWKKGLGFLALLGFILMIRALYLMQNCYKTKASSLPKYSFTGDY